MRLLRILPICGILLFVLVVAAPAFEPAKPGVRDRCPVCGMFVTKYPEWIAAIVFKDGNQLFFDGAKDMFVYYFSLPQGKVQREDIHGIYVTEYYSVRYAPVEEVLFVLGTNVHGPMGAELIPVAGRANAETFLKDYSGNRIVTFAEVTPELLPRGHH